MRWLCGVCLTLVVLAVTSSSGQENRTPIFEQSLGSLLRDARIQANLRLNDEVINKLTTLERNLADAQAKSDGVFEAAKKRPSQEQQLEKDALQLMSPEQLERLWQLQLQAYRHQNGLLATLRRMDIREKLQVTAEELAAWDRLSRATAEPLGKTLRSGQSLQKIQSETRKITLDLEVKLIAVLTPEQRNNWRQLQGEAFDFNIEESPFGSRRRIVYFSRVQSPQIQKTLELTPEQVTELTSIPQHSATSLSKIFSDEMKARLKELQYQSYRLSAGAGLLFAYREVVDVIQPTPAQRKDLEPMLTRALANFAAPGELPAGELDAQDTVIKKILTPEQQQKFLALLGKPLGQPLPDLRNEYRKHGVPGMWERTREPVMNYLTMPEFASELQLSADQVKALSLVVGEVRKAGENLARIVDGVRTLDGPALRKYHEIQHGADLGLIALLSAEQHARFDQLRFQLGMRNDFPYRTPLLRDPDVQQRLKLTPEELAALGKLEWESHGLSVLLLWEIPRTLGKDQSWWSEFQQEISREVLKQVAERHETAFSPELQARWKTLLGPRFPGRFRGLMLQTFGGYHIQPDDPR